MQRLLVTGPKAFFSLFLFFLLAEYDEAAKQQSTYQKCSTMRFSLPRIISSFVCMYPVFCMRTANQTTHQIQVSQSASLDVNTGLYMDSISKRTCRRGAIHQQQPSIYPFIHGEREGRRERERERARSRWHLGNQQEARAEKRGAQSSN